MNTNVTKSFWRLILVLAATLIAWQIIALNLSDYYVSLAQEGDTEAIDAALFWDASHPKALTIKARQLIAAENDDMAEPLLIKAIEGNPADARPLVLLADLRRRRGDEDLADQMIETADRLMPVHDKVQRAIAVYWAERGRLDLAVLHLSTAMSASPELQLDSYPRLLRIAGDRTVRQTLAPLTAEPPVWWNDFFHYVAKTADSIDPLRALMSMREASVSVAITESERNIYISRLRKEGLVAEAYLHWVNGLDTESLQTLGYLFNGNFERELSNTGFGWYARPPENSGIRINTSTSYGIDGRQALNVRFNGKRIRFHHLYQYLYLAPGDYKLAGKVRPDKLNARRGLQWIVFCSAGPKGNLGESSLFQGDGDWRTFEFDIQVPAECAGQRLRLLSVGARDVDHELDGSIWFDDMRIELRREAAIAP